jgi:hypothetical protein
MKVSEATLTVVCDALAKDAAGLDLTDAEDRAIFRMKVSSRFANAKVTAISAYARALGAEVKGRSRFDAVFALAGAWIERGNVV